MSHTVHAAFARRKRSRIFSFLLYMANSEPLHTQLNVLLAGCILMKAVTMMIRSMPITSLLLTTQSEQNNKLRTLAAVTAPPALHHGNNNIKYNNNNKYNNIKHNNNNNNMGPLPLSQLPLKTSNRRSCSPKF